MPSLLQNQPGLIVRQVYSKVEISYQKLVVAVLDSLLILYALQILVEGFLMDVYEILNPHCHLPLSRLQVGVD